MTTAMIMTTMQMRRRPSCRRHSTTLKMLYRHRRHRHRHRYHRRRRLHRRV
jgi:hypothetical protein